MGRPAIHPTTLFLTVVCAIVSFFVMPFALAQSVPANRTPHPGQPVSSTEQSGSIVGVPWRGGSGIIETVAQIMARESALVPFQGQIREAEHPVVRLPPPERENPNLPRVSEYSATGSVTTVSPLSTQTVGTKFLANQLIESGFVPPDVVGDVGPDQILVPSNGIIKVFDKTGAVGGLNTSTDNFFASVRTPTFGTSDPHVRYDRNSQRWFIVMIDVAAVNRVLLAVSSGSHISSASSFTFYEFEHDSVGTMPNSDTGGFADYPTLGVDANALYIGVNVFSPSYIGSTGFVVRKSSLISGGPIVVTAFRQIAGNTGAGLFTPQGVDNADPAATVGYFIGIAYPTQDSINIRRISNPGATPSISGILTVTPPSFWIPLLQPAKSSTRDLDTDDDRLFAAAIHKNRITGISSLWTAHHIAASSTGVGGSGGDRNAARWYEITNLTGTPTLNQSGTIFDGSSTNFKGFIYPSVMMSGQGHVVLGSSYASPADFAGVALSGRQRTGALGSMAPPTFPVTGTAAYNQSVGNPPRNRWGDFSQSVVDPTDDMTLWTFQEFANTNAGLSSGSWAVEVLQIKAPPPATPDTATPASVSQGSSVAVTIHGTSISGSEFFDPDVSYPQHISATVNGGGVTVNSVTFIDPTHISLNLTVSLSATLSARTITVTNPDGQSTTSASGILTIEAPTPIVLSGFSGAPASGGGIRLQWATVSEVNNYGFVVQRGPSLLTGYHDLPNGFVPGHGTTIVMHQYAFVDAQPDPAESSYRLKQIDRDGTVRYTEAISVALKPSVAMSAVPSEFSLDQNYPNPFNPSTVIRYGLPADAHVVLEVYNILGEKVMTLLDSDQEAGFHEAVLRNPELASGVYIYRLHAGSFVSTKKLVLTK